MVLDILAREYVTSFDQNLTMQATKFLYFHRTCFDKNTNHSNIFKYIQRY